FDGRYLIADNRPLESGQQVTPGTTRRRLGQFVSRAPLYFTRRLPDRQSLGRLVFVGRIEGFEELDHLGINDSIPFITNNAMEHRRSEPYGDIGLPLATAGASSGSPPHTWGHHLRRRN